MNSRKLWLRLSCRLLVMLLLVVTVARPAVTRAAPAAETVLSFVVSNEAPGHLVDWLIAQGHGNDTLLQVLSYLKAQSGGVISDAFYNQVAAAPPGSEVFYARLRDYAGLVGGIEIAADGTISIPSVAGKDYTGAAGFASAPGQSGQFILTYTHDVEHYIFTHSTNFGGGVTRDYYAWGIAWKARTALYLPLVRR